MTATENAHAQSRAPERTAFSSAHHDNSRINAANPEIMHGFNNFDHVRNSMQPKGNDGLHQVGFYDSKQGDSASGLRQLADGSDNLGSTTIGPDGQRVAPPSKAEKEAVDANSKTVKELFPNENQELRDAAYRELMRRECIPGYPSDTPEAQADRNLLEQRGVKQQVDEAIKQRAKERTDFSCVPTS